MDQHTATDNVHRFIDWFRQHGGYWHDSLQAQKDSTYGLHFTTCTPLSANTRIIACPAALVITKETALDAVRGLGVAQAALEGLNERQLISAYVALHFAFGLEQIVRDSSLAARLRHEPYITTLPTSAELLTPFQWTASELSLLEGLNLGHAVKARRELWKREWEEVERILKGVAGTGLTWDAYLLANTYISSRAFPSSLLDPASASVPINPSHTDTKPSANADKSDSVPANEVTPVSYPVLIPGLDTLNHRRNQAVTWVSVASSDSESAGSDDTRERVVGLVLRTDVGAGEQVFNNYGPKGNEELILGYGFSIPENPDDTLALKLGIPEDTLTQGVRDALARLETSSGSTLDRTWYIPRSGHLPPDLFDIVRIVLSVRDQAEQTPEEDAELEMDVAGMLLEMIQTKLERLNEVLERNEALVEDAADVRVQVWDMVQDLVQGQMDILAACNSILEQKMDELEAAAGGD